jgi:hypothetical protein
MLLDHPLDIDIEIHATEDRERAAKGSAMIVMPKWL